VELATNLHLPLTQALGGFSRGLASLLARVGLDPERVWRVMRLGPTERRWIAGPDIEKAINALGEHPPEEFREQEERLDEPPGKS